MQIGFVLSLIFATLIAIFAIQNSAIIYVKFFFTSFEVSQALIIFISAVLGAVIAMFLGIRREYTFKKEIKQLQKSASEKDVKINNLTTEISNFKKQSKISNDMADKFNENNSEDTNK